MPEAPTRTGFWTAGLTVVLAALYAWVGFAGHDLVRVLGIGGGLLIIAALAAARRSPVVAGVLLLAGALPLGVVAWWSVVAPVLAVLTVTLGWRAIQEVRSWQ